MPIERNKICKLVSVKKSHDWVNIYTCGCYFNEAVQIKWKKLNWNKISSFIFNTLIEGKTYICFYKKCYNLLPKEIVFSQKNLMCGKIVFMVMQREREFLVDYLCSCFFF